MGRAPRAQGHGPQLRGGAGGRGDARDRRPEHGPGRRRRHPGLVDGLTDLLPDSAAVENGELALGGISSTALAEQFGTPLVVYDEQTLFSAARAYREAAPDALVLYGVKAFPSVALLQLLAAEGLGADVSTLGELAFARAAGVPGERIVVHGNNKSDEELHKAAKAETRFVVLDALDEVERAAAAGVGRVLV